MTGGASDGVRVIIDNGEYRLQNKGDLAMLDVTVGRLRESWPNARIGFVTFEPALLRSYERRAEPLTFSEGGDWQRLTPARRLATTLPPAVVGPVTRTWRRGSEPPRRIVRRALNGIGNRRHPTPPASPTEEWPESRPRPRVPRAVETATLVLALGGGYLADVDRNQSHRTLDLFERAIERGMPTAMLGQGLGPMEDRVLLARAREVLPHVDLIAVREPVNGPRLLASLGVDEERVVLTGDDAIELAYQLRRPHPGNGIGVNLRIAVYSPVAQHVSDAVGRAVRAVAGELRAPLVPMAVSTYLRQDRMTTRPLVRGYRDVVPMLGDYSSPRDLMRRVGECAVVVTGAYHLAVFALSQGLPVIGLTGSRYYDYKFEGLENMFGTGITTVHLDSDDLEPRLVDAVRAAWRDAPARRADLLAAAARQINDSRAAYDRVAALVSIPPSM